MVKAVFLDRDGVINRSLMRGDKPVAPRALEDFQLLPGVPEAIQALKAAGYVIIVVTNQPDIGNGLADPTVVEAMHQQLLQNLPILEIYCCPHKQTDGCDCRKPKPGMLLVAKEKYGINLAQSYMIGDRASDVQAALAAGCTPIFIDYNYLETPDLGDTLRAATLLQASQFILNE